MILITTPGKVGLETARLLGAAHTPARLIARHPDKITGLGSTVEVVHGDLDDPSSLAAAMEDVSSVVLVSPAVPDQELRVIDAAAQAGVDHVVKITSKASADSPIERRRGQATVEAGLAASGLSHTLLRANGYMQNFLALAPQIAAVGAFGSSAADGRAGLVDARDVAAVAARIATEPDDHRGKTYHLTGPELLTYADVAAILSRALNRTIDFQPRSFEEDRSAMITAGVPAAIAEMNAQAFSLIATGDAAWVSQDVPAITGRPARSFDDFARDHIAAFTAVQQAS